MKSFRRAYTMQAFKLPIWGHEAEEPAPQWLVQRIQSGDLEINSLGGFTMLTPWGVQSCSGGDVILLTEDSKLEFAKLEDFDKFELLDESSRIAA